MQVILLKDVPKVGGVGEIVDVKPGYARNFLIPQKYALAASETNRKQRSHEERIAEFQRKKADQEAMGIAAKLNKIHLEFTRKVGEQQKLYGSVSKTDVAEALAAQGVDIDRRKIGLADVIKSLGSFQVPIRLRREVEATITVTVISDGTAPEVEASAETEEPAEAQPEVTTPEAETTAAE